MAMPQSSAKALRPKVVAEHGHEADDPASKANPEAEREHVDQRHRRGVHEHHGAEAEERHEHAPEIPGIDSIPKQHDDDLGDQAGDGHGEHRRATDARGVSEVLEQQLAVREEQRVHATAP